MMVMRPLVTHFQDKAANLGPRVGQNRRSVVLQVVSLVVVAAAADVVVGQLYYMDLFVLMMSHSLSCTVVQPLRLDGDTVDCNID